MKPILFNTDMVQAILEGRKSVTRRIVKPQHLLVLDSPYHHKHPETPDEVLIEKLCAPPYRPGDILYVRETWAYGYVDTTDFECRCNECFFEELKAETQKDSFLMPRYFYRTENLDGLNVRWRPSIHMPKEAARLFLRVRNVRVERLQDITPEQAREEGCDGRCNCPSSGAPGSLSCVTMDFSVEKFETVWDGTIKPADLPLYGWDADPLVWVIEFERINKEAALEGGN